MPANILPLMGRYQLGAAALAALMARRYGLQACLGVLEGAALVALNLVLGRLSVPWMLARSQPGGAPRQLGRIVALSLGKLLVQMGLAMALLVWAPPPPIAFMAGLATFAVAAVLALGHLGLKAHHHI